MQTVKDRFFDLDEAARHANCGVRDILELGAQGAISIAVYVDYQFVQWAVWDGFALRPKRGQPETGHFLLDPDSIRDLIEKSVTYDPWLIRFEQGKTQYGCVWRTSRGRWRVGMDNLRVSKETMQQVRAQAVGQWEPLDLEGAGPSRQERRKMRTRARNEWIYQRAEALKNEGVTATKQIVGKLLDEIPNEFRDNELQPETVRRILSRMKSENRSR